ncbi:U4/U6.U5 tri-snRNP-associated protein 1 [Plasmodium brasilianum]|uniref:U4/U6.U5 tri-snRNP-associated protein 1 n=1 Tax=Plasmodium brasilianum TaxID=5824 RepID=A0ACB9YCF1_PLABR|nr:U4/U6.U5 tri-snRNP-associated protein 1 [Plasmodium brasilianum]
MDDKECKLSIEETNKLREKLGLKMLQIEGKGKKKCSTGDEKNGDNKKKLHNTNKNRKNSEQGENKGRKKNYVKDKEQIAGKEEKGEEEKGEAEKQKQTHIQEETNTAKTISAEFKDDINDVEKWVNKTRNTMNKRLAQEGIKYSDDEDEDEEENEEENENKSKNKKKKKVQKKEIKKRNKTNDFVSNVKVEHKNEDITGDNMILTLKDTNVLNNEEEDCLINEELKKQNVQNILSKNDDSFWNKNFYNPLSYYDDTSKKVEDNSSIRMIPKYEDEKYSFNVNIKYDQNDQSSRNDGKSKIPANDKGMTKEEKELKKGSSNKKKEQVKEEQKTVDTDIFKLKKRKIKNISRRKKEEDAWDFLYDDEPREEDQHRKFGKENEEENIGQSREPYGGEYVEQTERTDIDRDSIVDDVIKKIKEEQMHIKFNYFDNIMSENEEENELYELLEKGNNFKKRKKENNYQNELLKYIVINDEGNKINDDKNNNDIIKLTNASEFCKNISLPLDINESEKNSKFKKNEKSVGHMDEDQDSSVYHHSKKNNENKLINTYNEVNDWIKNGEKKDSKKKKKIDNDLSDDMDDENDDLSQDGVSEIFNEIKLDEGLYGALEYLKTKGELNIEDKIYRNPENKPLHMSTDKNDIKLDYKNDAGKVMTPKETFRYISWIFHGKKQGKNKLEKKIKRMEMERRFKENPIDSLPTLNVLKKYQQVQKKSFFTLSSNN